MGRAHDQGMKSAETGRFLAFGRQKSSKICIFFYPPLKCSFYKCLLCYVVTIEKWLVCIFGRICLTKVHVSTIDHLSELEPEPISPVACSTSEAGYCKMTQSCIRMCRCCWQLPGMVGVEQGSACTPAEWRWDWRQSEPPQSAFRLVARLLYTCAQFYFLPSVLWHCWSGIRKSIRPVKNWMMRCCGGYLSGARCRLFAYGQADATAFQNPIISCLILIQTGFTFLVPAYPGCPGKEAVKQV